jgi:hypothetical protein
VEQLFCIDNAQHKMDSQVHFLSDHQARFLTGGRATSRQEATQEFVNVVIDVDGS